MDPCKICADHFCCRQMCIEKKRYLDYVEGERSTYRVPATNQHRKRIVTVNKNGIRREEYCGR